MRSDPKSSWRKTAQENPWWSCSGNYSEVKVSSQAISNCHSRSCAADGMEQKTTTGEISVILSLLSLILQDDVDSGSSSW